MAAKKTGFIVGAVAGAGVAAAALAGAGLRLPPAVGQTAQHQPYGGVVPEIAARAHVDAISGTTPP